MFTSVELSGRVAPSGQIARASHPLARASALRAALAVAALVAGLGAAALASPASVRGFEPTLVVLLRAMAVIKGGAAVAAFALAFWRFARPVSTSAACGYVAGVATLVAATVLIWNLSFIVGAAVLFHVGLFGFIVLAWREGMSGIGMDTTLISRTARYSGAASRPE